MKSCEHCGCLNDNINRYCRNCGTLLDRHVQKTDDVSSDPLAQPQEERIPEESGDPQPTTPIKYTPLIDFDFSDEDGLPLPDAPAQDKPAPRIYSTHPAVQACKRAGGRADFLLLCIFLSALTALCCFASVSNYIRSGIGGGLLFSLAPVPPLALLSVGGWLHYAASRNIAQNHLRTSGLTLLFVGCILLTAELILATLALFGLCAMAARRLAAFGVRYDPDALAVLLIFAVPLAMTVPLTVWLSLAARGFYRLRSVASDRLPKRCFSLFCGVFALLLSLAHGWLIGFALAQADLLLLAGALLCAAALFCFGVWTLRLRADLRSLSLSP